MRTTAAPSTQSSHEHFAGLLAELSKPAAFPFAVPPGEPEVIQTHASAVLLARDRAYKVKKPKDFGFFDFSTPALRRKYCMLEVALNTRLAPAVYLGVAPVLAMRDGRAIFGRTLPADHVPQPGATLDGGLVVDYAVVMVRLPEAATLQARIAAGSATVLLMRRVALRVAAFHQRARTNARIARFGSLSVLRRNWQENFAQIGPQVGCLLDQQTMKELEEYVDAFMHNRPALFESRIREGCIRDCHGDLRLQHVYALDGEHEAGHEAAHEGGHAARQQLAIIDCIEFNERFRYGDVAAEVAFLAMELEAEERADLASAFLDAYLAATGDASLREVLPFYLCYRACVRGKVEGFLADEPEVPAAQREAARARAQQLFALARRYAHGRVRPALVMVGGTMGTGKSTLAAHLHQTLGWPLVASDLTRKRLAQIDPQEPVAHAFGQGIYSPEWTARTYAAMLEEARAMLAAGRSVLLDATFGRRAFRLVVADVARQYGAQAALIECRCPPQVARERLALRWQARTHRVPAAPVTAPGDRRTGLNASDGRPELFEQQLAAWEAYDLAAEDAIAHIVVSTEQPPDRMVEPSIDALGRALGGDLTLEAG